MDNTGPGSYDGCVRPLYHPHPDEMTVQGVLYALSDPVRVRIFVKLLSADCTKNCATFTNVASTPLPKSTLSQHFKILREAGLIRSERRGVELLNRVRCEEIQTKFGDMIKAILDAYQKECRASTKKAPKRRVKQRTVRLASAALGGVSRGHTPRFREK